MKAKELIKKYRGGVLGAIWGLVSTIMVWPLRFNQNVMEPNLLTDILFFPDVASRIFWDAARGGIEDVIVHWIPSILIGFVVGMGIWSLMKLRK